MNFYQSLIPHFGQRFDTTLREALTPPEGGFDAVLTLRGGAG
jgi:hypothetical protein